MTAQPYKPELRSIPLTFMDCPHLKEKDFWGCINVCWINGGAASCEVLRMHQRCPGGFP